MAQTLDKIMVSNIEFMVEQVFTFIRARIKPIMGQIKGDVEYIRAQCNINHLPSHPYLLLYQDTLMMRAREFRKEHKIYIPL